MKRFIIILSLFMAFAVLCGKEFNQQADFVDSETVTYKDNIFDVTMWFHVNVLTETTQKPIFLVIRLGYIPKNNKPIQFNCNDSLYVGGNHKILQKYPLSVIHKLKTTFENKAMMFMENTFFWNLNIDEFDPSIFFKCDKMRFFTNDETNYDIVIPKKVMETLVVNFQNVLKDADELYRRKTDKTYGF